MKQCKQCLFYDEEYDQLRQSGDDILIIGEKGSYKEKHFCRFYSDKKGIAEEILSDKMICDKRFNLE